jgi:excisionase family DNA binding protein
MTQQSTVDHRLAVSVEEAAAMLSVGRTTLYAAISTGELPSLKIGRRRLIRIQTLESWIDGHVDPVLSEVAS